MNGKRVAIFSLAMILMVFASPIPAAEEVQSLRGVTAIDANSEQPVYKKWKKKSDPIARDYAQQPPLIPHKSQSHKINLEKNKCMDCHGMADYEEKGATKVSDSHFRDRDGNPLSDLSASRYFCTQCHVEQRETDSLVDNEFVSAGN